jgi:hypothetical protein
VRSIQKSRMPLPSADILKPKSREKRWREPLIIFFLNHGRQPARAAA